MTKPKRTIKSPQDESLKKRITALELEKKHLRSVAGHLATRLSQIEEKLGLKPPISVQDFRGKLMRIIMWMDAPLVLADDVAACIPSLPKSPYRQSSLRHPGPMVAARLLRLGLGARELTSIKTALLSDDWKLTAKSVSRAFGVSPKTRVLSFVTPLGIETLERQAPGIKAWFAQASKQLPNC